jgi:hypothetical protein
VFEETGSWMWVFIIVSALDLTAAALALLVLKPMRRAQRISRAANELALSR